MFPIQRVLVLPDRGGWRGGTTLFEDTFERGLCGWTWLMDQFEPTPGPVWSPRRSRGAGSMLLQTSDVAPDVPGNDGKATAIKRLMLPRNEDGSYVRVVEFEAIVGWASNNADHPGGLWFGIDTQRGDITDRRQYYKIKFVNYDEDTDQRVQQFRVASDEGDVNIPGATLRHWNEAKAGSFHVRYQVDIQAQQYIAFWLNGEKFDLGGREQPGDTYVGEGVNNSGYFDEGLNFSFDLINRYDSPEPAMVHVDYARGSTP